ncbi:hypothetical protein JCM3766R1_005725 [Sporobolomyces carnicolor]
MAALRVVVASNGYTSLVGPLIDSISATFANVRDADPKHPPHVTLLTKHEAQFLKKRDVANPFFDVEFEPRDVVPLGTGGAGGQQFVSILLNRANRIRLESGLSLKFFHITLTLPPAQQAEDYFNDLVAHFFERLSGPDTPLCHFDALAYHHFLRREDASTINVALVARRRFPTSPRPFLRIADSSIRRQHHKLAMVAYARAYDLSAPADMPLRRYALKQIGRCSRATEWGPTVAETEQAQFDGLDEDVRVDLFRPWSLELRDACVAVAEGLEPPDLSIESRERISVRWDRQEYKLMRFFRWIVPFQIAVSSTPRDLRDVEVLSSPPFDFKHILSLTEESPLPETWFGRSLRHTFLPITDQRSPSIEQIQLFLRLATDGANLPLLVHCGGGKGRAGVMIASWICAYGFGRPPTVWRYPAFSPSQAISLLRHIRPGSIETREQEEGLRRFYKHVAKEGRPLPSLLAEPSQMDPTIVGTISDADLLILVGLPGSGKTSFRQALALRDKWKVVSGDDDGGRSAVHAGISATRPGDRLIVDRCNVTVESRREVIALAQHCKNAVAIHFATSPDLCLQRAQLRPDHPSLRPGAQVRAAIKQFASQFVSPSLDEGFAAVVTIPSIAASRALVRSLAPPISLLKFPRTPHLVDLGAATSDDLVTPTLALRSDQQIVITEKLDGANMGFSLDRDRTIVVQNRSHFVDSAAHPQFRRLDAWVHEHGPELQRVLGRDEHFPERYILYGEWMAAKHSIPYDLLPDLFLAFDLYDRASATFVSRKRLVDRLRGTTLRLTPELCTAPSVPSEASLVAMIRETSLFSTSQRREGIYIKVETEDKVVSRQVSCGKQ